MKYILLPVVLVAAFACRMPLEPYDLPQDRLNFLYPADTVDYADDPTIRHTFVYDEATVERDTIWLPVRVSGFVTGTDRPVALRQIDSPEPKAQPGVHFMPVDDAQLTAKYYWLRAGQAAARIPVVVFRHPDLKEKEYSLTLEIVPNGTFAQGFPTRTTRQLFISDMLTQPSKWDWFFEYYLGGTYGPVKHQLMIDAVRDLGMVINDAWIERVLDPYNPDMNYLGYLSDLFTAHLIEVNRQRASQGLGVLREEPLSGEIEGVIVRFTKFGTDQPYE